MSEIAGIRYEERDLDFLRGLFESRLMRLDHAAALYFGDSLAAAQQRVLKLKNAGVVAERPRRMASDPSILHITRRGYELLEERGRLEGYPRFSWDKLARRADVKPLTLDHELEVMDVMAALVPAIRAKPGLAVAQMGTWPLLHEFRAHRRFTDGRGQFVHREMVTKPDGFLRVRETKADGRRTEHAFFLELDRGSESLDRLVGKASGYKQFYKQGGYARRCGGPRENFQLYPFRVLMVVPSQARRNNAAERLLKNNLTRQVWLAAREDLLADPLARVWISPAALGKAVRGTPYDLDKLRFEQAGRNRPGREECVQARVERRALFEPETAQEKERSEEDRPNAP